MKRIFMLFCLLSMLCFCLIGCGKDDQSVQEATISNVLQQLEPSDDTAREETEAFVQEYTKVDYKGLYREEVAKIVIDYHLGTQTSTMNYSIYYYSTKEISGEEAGYIGACLEEAAWLTWGMLTDIGIYSSIYSRYEGDTRWECLYWIGPTDNTAADEFGDVYYYDKFAKAESTDVSVGAGALRWEMMSGSEIDPLDPRPVYEWEAKQQQEAYGSYIQTREYINRSASELLENDSLQTDSSATGSMQDSVLLAIFPDGTWWDIHSQRCNLKATVIDDTTVQIEINWSSGASSNTSWHITGHWNEEEQRLTYKNGIKYENEKESYSDGKGFFYFNSGLLYWADYLENAGMECAFEPPTLSEESQQAYSVEELLGKSANEIIDIYGGGFIEVEPEGDQPYFYYEIGDPYRYIGDSNSRIISTIESFKEGCEIIKGLHVGDDLQKLYETVLKSEGYWLCGDERWYNDSDGKKGWVSFETSQYYYSCYINNNIIKSFSCSLQ